jgi:succinoglycan biosynthesis protein ExoM
MLVEVGITTFRRSELLRRTLASLLAQELDAEVELRIIVVDNDVHQTARPTVEQVLSGSRHAFIYAVGPEQNIALARNRLLDLATGDFLALIDDDEHADPAWLQHLLDCAERYRADVVFGPALPVHPEGVPEWIVAGRFFDEPRHPTGTRLILGSGNNLLMRRRALISHQARFDPAFGRTGGSDTDLYWRLHRSGAKLVWCDEAIVHAPVALNRATLGYLVARSFRYGRTTARVRRKLFSPLKNAVWLVSRTFFLATGVALGLALLHWQRPLAVWLLCKGVRSGGHLSVLLPGLERFPALTLRPEQRDPSRAAASL